MHFERPDGAIGLTLFFTADDDEAAIATATRELNEHSSFALVEVCQGPHTVSRISR
ncbi:hypothetical protein ACO2Q1_02410 [Brevundimonas sp. VNH65]|uniref:hypothetical protein n=1 Tax=Brevundimonas sp. VNH65 TaxID=3400917 RepID=UPI003BFC511E